jgi:phosphatidylglycerophosphatase A
VPPQPTPEREGRAARWIATVGGLGDLLPAPGTTAGSAPAAAVWWLLGVALGTSWKLTAATAAMAIAAAVVGIWASEVEARRRGRGDPGPVVIDEVAGQWLCFAVALPVSTVTGSRDLVLFVAAGFVLFRVFDVVKPWPVRRLERLPGGVGIVADDLAAGGLAGILLAVAWHFVQLQVPS